MFKIITGYLLTLMGVLIIGLTFYSEIIGHGLNMGIIIGNYSLPIMMTFVIGIALLIIGLVIAFDNKNKIPNIENN